MDYYETATKGIIMIVIAILSFSFGAAIAATATHLHNANLILTMKADTIVALKNQAEDSFRSGYMRGYASRRRKTEKIDETVTHLIPAMV